jgi:hypothetical protein
MFFFQVAFDAVTEPELKESLNAIPTTFRLRAPALRVPQHRGEQSGGRGKYMVRLL